VTRRDWNTGSPFDRRRLCEPRTTKDIDLPSTVPPRFHGQLLQDRLPPWARLLPEQRDLSGVVEVVLHDARAGLVEAP